MKTNYQKTNGRMRLSVAINQDIKKEHLAVKEVSSKLWMVVNSCWKVLICSGVSVQDSDWPNRYQCGGINSPFL